MKNENLLEPTTTATAIYQLSFSHSVIELSDSLERMSYKNQIDARWLC